MEKIKKQISIDKCRSHKHGLLPFIQYGTGKYISGETNYGGFVCDLGVKIIVDEGVDIPEYDYKELNSTNGKIGDFCRIIEDIGVPGTLDFIPANTIFMWNGTRWVHYRKLVRYRDIITRYNVNKNILDRGIFCECVSVPISDTAEEVFLRKYDDTLLELGCTDLKKSDLIFTYEPVNSLYFVETSKNTYKCLDNNVYLTAGEKYVILDNWEEYMINDVWGYNNALYSTFNGGHSGFIQCVKSLMISSDAITEYFHLLMPTVDIPLLLENECVPDTILYPYEYDVIGEGSEMHTINGEEYDIKIGTNLATIDGLDNIKNESKIISGVSFVVESKLNTLNHHEAFNITDEHYGIMEGFHSDNTLGELFKCLYYTEIAINNSPTLKNRNVYQVIDVTDENYPNYRRWWECIKVSDSEKSNYICGDEEEIGNNEKKYRNITMLSCIPSYIPNPKPALLNTYYFYAKFQNGKIKPYDNDTIDTYSEIKKISYPFKVGTPVNINSYDSDVIVYDIVSDVNMTENGNDIVCEINYILGATSGKTDTGIHYKEYLKYESGITKNAWIENTNQADLYYERLNYDTNKETFFNDNYNANFEVRPATITQMEVFGYSENFVEVPFISKEGTENLYYEPSVASDIVFNRGNAAGWEKHFKLSECNSFQDLKNYGNNVFNL